MWIRSQDKEVLANANDADRIEIVQFNRLGRPDGVWIYVNDIKFAAYSTKEKALKVLDEIQKLIYDYQLDEPFQMPQDDEVENESN
jgi:hypothetical protein